MELEDGQELKMLISQHLLELWVTIAWKINKDMQAPLGGQWDGEWETQSLEICYGNTGFLLDKLDVVSDSLKVAAKLVVAFKEVGLVCLFMHTKILHYWHYLNWSLIQKTCHISEIY